MLPIENLRPAHYEHLNNTDLTTHAAFSKFIQLNELEISKLTDLMIHEPSAGGVFMFICEMMDRYNAVVMSHKVITERLGISRATVCRAVKVLVDEGFICVKKSGNTNVYIANPDITWKSYGRNRKYCEFEAKVVLSASEQTDDNTDDIKENEKVIVPRKRVVLGIHEKAEYEPSFD